MYKTNSKQMFYITVHNVQDAAVSVKMLADQTDWFLIQIGFCSVPLIHVVFKYH